MESRFLTSEAPGNLASPVARARACWIQIMITEATPKSIKIIALVQIVILVMGILISGAEVKYWKQIYTPTLIGEEIPVHWGLILLSKYGIFLLLIPLSWSVITFYFANKSDSSNTTQRFLILSGFILILFIFLFIVYMLFVPWIQTYDSLH